VRKMSFLVLLLVAGHANGLDQQQAEKVAKVREAVMTVVGWNVAPMAAMAKEELPYDAAEFEKRAKRIAEMLAMTTDAFRPDTRDAVLDTESLDVIWEEFDELRRLAGEARDKARAAETVAGTGDFAQVQAAFLDLGKACKACHERFREED
jgi:cytochrome c556